MVDLLNEHAVLLASVASIVTIIGFLWSIFKKDKDVKKRKVISAKNRSVAAESINNSSIDMSGGSEERKDG